MWVAEIAQSRKEFARGNFGEDCLGAGCWDFQSRKKPVRRWIREDCARVAEISVEEEARSEADLEEAVGVAVPAYSAEEIAGPRGGFERTDRVEVAEIFSQGRSRIGGDFERTERVAVAEIFSKGGSLFCGGFGRAVWTERAAFSAKEGAGP